MNEMQPALKNSEKTSEKGERRGGIAYHNLFIESVSFFKGLVKSNLTKLTTHSGLGKLNNSIDGILNTIRGKFRVHNLFNKIVFGIGINS
jgi:hypothetical protein